MKNLLCVIWLITSLSGVAQPVKRFENGGAVLYYEEYGRGPALYILSGGPGEAPYYPYRQLADSLKAYYTCILLHQRGSGLSRDMPINAETISIEKYTQDIEALRALRGDRQLVLLGVSWGGLLAMNYAVTYPQRVAHLLLVCSAPPSYALWHVLYANQYARHSRAELDSMAMWQKIFSTRTERELDSLKRVDPNGVEVCAYREFILLHVRAMYYDRSKISRPVYEQLFTDFNFQPIPLIDQEVVETRFDITRKLKKLKIPALIVYGRQDDQGESTFHLQQQCLRHHEVHVIEQCGHEIMEEQPEAFYKILLGYVKRIQKH